MMQKEKICFAKDDKSAPCLENIEILEAD